MSQNDFNIANQGFPSFRSDLNDALQSLASTSSGATAPSTTYAGQLWYDSTNNVLKFRNEANSAWIDPPISGTVSSLSDLGVNASASELNILDGATLSTTELNYNDVTTLGTVQASKTVTADASGNVTFGDNDKAIFGAGSDLQIYHDSGTGQSIIHEGGPSVLKIRASDLRLSNAANTADYLSANDGAEVSIRYNNSVKLATTSTGVTITGDATAANFNTTSDATLKTNVETLTGSLDAINAMRGVSFDWIENGGSEVGFIAQEVEQVLPQVVNTNDDGIKSVKYGNIVAVLVEALKEQQAQIDALTERLDG